MDSNVKEVIDSATLEISHIDQLQRDEVLALLKQYKFCRITGLLDPEKIKQSRHLLQNHFQVANDNPVYGDTPADVQSNFQKLSIGRARHGGVDRPRFMRVFYNPIWAEDIYNLRSTFTQIAQVRNILGGHHREFAIAKPEEGMWTAARMHLFPRGGGFMVTHRDTVLPAVLKENGISGGFYQPVALFTQKGEDFYKGGGTITLEGEMIEYEDYASLGDIVIYNALTDHGVNDVDPDLPYRQDGLNGRISALVTLYKDLS